MDANKILLDSNIIIYTGLVESRGLHSWLESQKITVSVISRIEVLGYHKLTIRDKRYFEAFFSQAVIYQLSDQILDLAISLRQMKKMSLGDSLIAATAIVNHIPLITANTKDFNHIEDLQLVNPIK